MPFRKSAHFGPAAGFTLLELITVLFILGILSILVLPGMGQFTDGIIVRSAAYALANDIRRAQNLALQEGRGYRIDLYTRDFYYLLRADSATSTPVKRVEFSPRILEIRANFQTGSPAHGIHAVRYRSTGTPSQAGTITLKTRTGRAISLTVEVATGRVRVYE